MLEYKSSIVIKISNAKNPNLIKEHLFFAKQLDSSSYEIEIKTNGSPDQKFEELANAIWQADPCDIEFFVSESKLTYSSPAVFSSPTATEKS